MADEAPRTPLPHPSSPSAFPSRQLSSKWVVHVLCRGVSLLGSHDQSARASVPSSWVLSTVSRWLVPATSQWHVSFKFRSASWDVFGWVACVHWQEAKIRPRGDYPKSLRKPEKGGQKTPFCVRKMVARLRLYGCFYNSAVWVLERHIHILRTRVGTNVRGSATVTPLLTATIRS